jgi:hypothetical protein
MPSGQSACARKQQSISSNDVVKGVRGKRWERLGGRGGHPLGSTPASSFPVGPPRSSSSLEYSNRASVTFRKRSQHNYLAKEVLGLVADCGREKLDLRYVLIHFDNWMESIDWASL